MRVLFLSAFVFASFSLQAQPVLNFKRIVNNWPTVELYFLGSCEGETSYSLTRDNYTLHENGINIPEFTFWCPEPQGSKAFNSLVIGVDITSYQFREAAYILIDTFAGMLDTQTDESALVWYDTYLLRELGMTNLHKIIPEQTNNIPYLQESRYLDIAYASILKLINEGNNPCRAVILFADSIDNISVHTRQDVVMLANRNRVRVHTVALSDSADYSELERIAYDTGGLCYVDPEPYEMVLLFNHISCFPYDFWYECMITYQATCMNGALRTVDLTLKGHCNGSDTKTKTYRAPMDTSTYSSLMLGMEGVAFATTEQYTVPFSILEPSDGSIIDGFEVDIEFDTQQFEVTGMSIPSATLLQHPGGLLNTFIPNGVHIAYQGGIESGLAGGLFFIDIVKRYSAVSDTLIYSIRKGKTYNSCLLIEAIVDTLILTDQVRLAVTALDQVEKCGPASVRLHASTGFGEYRWSNGDSTQTIEVHQSGRYSVSAERIGGVTILSDTIDVFIHEPTIPQIIVEGNPARCYGDSVRLSISGEFASYAWSNGKTDSSIVVHNSGTYWVKATNEYGCTYHSSSTSISIEPESIPQITGTTVGCPMEFQEYKLSYTSGNAAYTWQVSGGSIIGGQGTHTIHVQWQNDSPGNVTVLAQYASCAYTDTLVVDLLIPNKPAIIVDGPRTVCQGRETVLKADTVYQYCYWNTGDRTLSITVSKPGVYIMEAGHSQQCLVVSDTVIITAAPAAMKPTIARRGDTLFSTNGSSYVWLENGTPIQGETEQYYVLQHPGEFAVITSNEYGCIAQSEPFDVTVLGVEEPSVAHVFSLDVYPTVITDEVFCVICSATPADYTITLHDPLGRVCGSAKVWNESGSVMRTFSLRGLPSGVYYIRVISKAEEQIRRITKL